MRLCSIIMRFKELLHEKMHIGTNYHNKKCFLFKMLASKYQGIIVTKKQEYSCMQKLLCCKCFACCQEEKVMTSDLRKETFQRMMEDYLIKDDDQLLLDPVKLMILIYVCNDDHIPAKHIERCKINPSTGVINYRTDLEFYVPQLCNYIVFYRSLQNNYLRQALQKMAKLNFYFAHLYYFYMKSLEKNITKEQIQVLRPVADYNKRFRKDLGAHYKDIQLTCLDLFIENNFKKSVSELDEFTKNIIFDYESTKEEYGKLLKTTKIRIQDLYPKKYTSIFDGQHQINSSFESTLQLFEDLFYVCNELGAVQDKKEKAKELIKMINENLPSNAYVPFSKNSYRICNVLKIVVGQVKIFSTKERAPMCLCIETYCPADILEKSEEEKFWTNVQVPITLKMMTFSNRASYFAKNYQKTAEFKRYRQSSLQIKKWGEVKNIMVEERLKQEKLNLYYQNKTERQVSMQGQALREKQDNSVLNEMASVKLGDHLLQTLAEERPQNIESKHNSSGQSKKKSLKHFTSYNQNTKKFYDKQFEAMFGQPLKDAKQRISKNSIFGDLKSWDILYIIIKTHDDLKQEQFAMQLIHQFDYIFKLEKLPLILTTYQVLSMGPDRGIIEMVKDSVTFDRLQKTLQTSFPTKLNLRSFFQIYFGGNVMEAKQNFLKSLAAYCVVMYIIQAKDRHNGNILLHRNGKIFHIDFGFFLSNMPGKGIELQRDCPFKLLTEYVQVLDGVDSYYFKKFREYFFLGFKAIRKHQNKVLMLVKLMYSTSGMLMPCFVKGEAAITAMDRRINPPGVTNDSLLNEHCQQLINLSLDNWAAKWYDRFQYWAQGIFY